MKNKLAFAVLAMGVLVFVIMITSCTSASGSLPVPVEESSITPKLNELLGKYMGVNPVTGGGGVIYNRYYIDPLHFEEFKAEVDAGGEYVQSHIWTGEDESLEMGITVLEWILRPDDFNLSLKEGKSLVDHMYKKIDPESETPNLKESLRKYVGSHPETWGEEGLASVYYLDAARFETFKAELDAEGEYQQVDNWTDDRDWGQGKFFARFIVRPDGKFQLELLNTDNSVVEYMYEKIQ